MVGIRPRQVFLGYTQFLENGRDEKSRARVVMKWPVLEVPKLLVDLVANKKVLGVSNVPAKVHGVKTFRLNTLVHGQSQCDVFNARYSSVPSEDTRPV